jgi:uncharacterized repeat protein (TIGR03803 family)
MRVASPFLLVLAAIVACVGQAGAQTVTDIFRFIGVDQAGDPLYVMPVQGRDGKLYGTLYGPFSNGATFRVSIDGRGSTIPYGFDGVHGSRPAAGVTLATDGNFYGTTQYGGSSNLGVLYRMTPSGSVTVLHNFLGGQDGSQPVAPPIQGSDGNLYGTTGGDITTAATVYQYVLSSATFTTLYVVEQTTGQYFVPALIQATDGNLYGSVSAGGSSNCGAIFELALAGTVLNYYSFPCGTGGSYPVGPVLQASDGNFYGMTAGGGTKGNGTVFKLDQSFAVSILYNFGGKPDGASPLGGLMQATDGKLYGTTAAGGRHNYGSVFQVTTAGSYTPLYSFSYLDGYNALGTLTQHTSGKMYGTIQVGKTSWGAVFSLDMGSARS